MKKTRAAKRRAAGISGAKIAITSATLAATLGGWAAIGANDPVTAQTAPDSAAAPLAQGSTNNQQPDQQNTLPPSGFGERRRGRGFQQPGSGFGSQIPSTGQTLPTIPGFGNNDDNNTQPTNPGDDEGDDDNNPQPTQPNTQAPSNTLPSTPNAQQQAPSQSFPVQPRARTRSSR